ncbi:hypothetical protein [Cytobacillus praedii]|uniref:hypothetical protein n=1 Tax=Cytobacillus praedii TaxID=1742358 RepID=UPI001F61D84C|nr:hypothetical protein [Cytobacillus praedii]
MKKITLWSKVNRDENGKFLNAKFNHIEDGWIEGVYPKPISEEFTNQKAWSKSEWIYKFGTLDKNFKVETL